MGRTADSYLKEAGAQPIEHFYEFANESQWPVEKLWERVRYLQEQRLAGEREEQRFRELGHLAFELACKQNEEIQDGE